MKLSTRTTFIMGAATATAVAALGSHVAQTATQMGAITFESPIGTGTALLILALSILANAFICAAESALRGLRPIHAKLLRDIGDRRSETVQKLLENRAHLLTVSTIAIKTGRFFILLSGFLLALDILHVGSVSWKWTLNWTTMLVTAAAVSVPISILSYFLGELVPHSIGSIRPQRVALRLFPLIQAVSLIFTVPAALVSWITDRLSTRFAPNDTDSIENEAEEEIKTMVETAEESGQIESDEKELLHSVFEFNDKVARQVMTPRVDVDAAPLSAEPSELLEVIRSSGHSRSPIYVGTDDRIIGLIHAKDLLMAFADNKEVDIQSLMRPALFVPENKDLHELLKDLRTSRAQLAVVQDEFGGTAGIITIEDIVEELVGEIVDEYDEVEPENHETSSGLTVDGKTHITDVNELIGSKFESEDFDTIGGFAFGHFGRQPKVGESLYIDGFTLTVDDTDGRRILRLRIEPIADHAS